MAKTQTELTAKRWKAGQAAGCLGMVVCAAFLGLGIVIDDPNDGHSLIAAGLVFCPAFAGLWLTCRVLAWRHHC